jgi:hypothetical protein
MQRRIPVLSMDWRVKVLGLSLKIGGLNGWLLIVCGKWSRKPGTEFRLTSANWMTQRCKNYIKAKNPVGCH